MDHLLESPWLVTSATVATLAALYIATASGDAKKAGTRSLYELPGPPRQFLLGSAAHFPKDSWYEVFSKWREEYGDVIFVPIATMRTVIIHSLSDAEELLNKRANVWSGRPNNRMVADHMGLSWSLLLTSPGKSFNEQRSIFRKVLGAQAIIQYDPLVSVEARNLVESLRDSVGNPSQTIQATVAPLTIKMTYGSKIYEEHGKELADVNMEALEFITWCFSQVWIVNILPISRLLPSWFPGLKYPAFAKKGRELVSAIRNRGFDLVKTEIERGSVNLSIVSKHIHESEFDPDVLQNATAMMYLGGVDTISTALSSFFCHMLMFPDVQKQIQAEVDSEVTSGELPTSKQAVAMKYLGVAWKESLRLAPPFPTSVPHVNTSDDVFKGYYIPKGTLLITNVMFMLRDPRIWGEDADVFRPERFLDGSQRAQELSRIESVAFGFGRRLCPGRHLADRVGLTLAACVLATYDIVPLEGEDIPTRIEFTKTQTRRPLDVKCRFVSRG